MTTEKTRPPLVFQSRVQAAPAVVFDAFFREPGRWLCREASIDPQVGGQLRLCWPDGCSEGLAVTDILRPLGAPGKRRSSPV